MLVVSLLLFATATMAQASDTKVSEITVPVTKCSEPVQTIAISQVECTAASCSDSSAQAGGMAYFAALFSGTGGVKSVGKGVKSMLTNAIKETNCFKIIDLEQFKKMKEMMEATGQVVTPPKIDFYVNGQITSIELS
jgi:curli biogenesis system outer membrane secretion channel CsgG